MDIDLIESKYTELKYAFENNEITADQFQNRVDELRTQDDYGRYWMIGANSGVWYYYDGVKWIQANPHEADTLPFVDENDVYWMLGKETNEWYYFDGEAWVKPDDEVQHEPQMNFQEPAQDQTQYYQDEDGRYWARGAKSGEWYYYDETGWHRGDDLPGTGQAPSQDPYAQPVGAPNYNNFVSPFQAGQPYGAPLPNQPPPTNQAAYGQPVPQVQPQPQPGGWYHFDGEQWTVYQEEPQQPSPAEAMPDPALWSYYDGEQWLRYQDDPSVQDNTPPPSQAEAEAGSWYYFDGQAWQKHVDEDEIAQSVAVGATAGVGAAAVDAYYDDEDYVDEDVDDVVEIEDLDDFIEIVEVDEDDIIDPDENTIDAEFQVEVLKPGQESATVAETFNTTQHSTRAQAPIETGSRQGQTTRVKAEPDQTVATPAQPRKTAKASVSPKVKPKTQAQSQPQPVGPGAIFRTLPLWLWTSFGGVVTLFVAAAVIIAALYLLSNREQAVAMIEAQQTPTLQAVPTQITPTFAPTPTPVPPTNTPVPLANYTSSYFGFSIDYPAGWTYKEEDDLVIFAPSNRALDPSGIHGAALWVLLDSETNLTDLLVKGLNRFEPISEMAKDPTNIGNQSWASAIIEFDAPDLGEPARALVASTVFQGQGYTFIAVAPTTEWNAMEPLFAHPKNTFAFTQGDAVAEAETPTPTPTSPATEPTEPSEAATATETSDTSTTDPTATSASRPTRTATSATTSTRTPTATATPRRSAEPLTHEVESGDTLLGIAVQYDVTVDDILEANGMDEDDILSIGQVLVIPQEGVEIVTPEATSEDEETPEPDETSTPEGEDDERDGTATVTPDPDDEEDGTATPPAEATETAEPEEEETPTPVADATLSGRIVYPSYSTDIQGFNIWSTNVDGSDPLIIAGNASQPNFSNNGTLFAYRSWTPSERGMFYINYSAGKQDLLTTFIEDSLPVWLNDGRLLFSSRREGDRVPRLYVVSQQGGDDESLGFISEYADVLADGHIVARGCTPAGECGLWKLLPDGSGPTRLSVDTSDTAPAGRPQGGRIAIMSFDRGSAGNWEIWTINADGSSARRLTENPANDGLPTWSPDGQSIAFVSDRGGVWAIWAMNADGSNQRKLFNMQGPPDGQVMHDVPNSKGWLEERIVWIR